MDKLTEALVTIFGLVVGVATLAVIVSNKSNTTGVLQNLFSGFGNILSVATGPVTGAVTAPNLGYAQGSGFGGFSVPNMGFNNTGGFPN